MTTLTILEKFIFAQTFVASKKLLLVNKKFNARILIMKQFFRQFFRTCQNLYRKNAREILANQRYGRDGIF